MHEKASVIPGRVGAGKRTVKVVPFVELAGGRIQGVVSSGSDIERVYVSFLEGGTGDFYCCTNNNRPCAGLGGSPCKHITQMVDEALEQFGPAAVAAYLGLDGDSATYESAYQVFRKVTGSQRRESPGVVFSRFLDYLRYCELTAEPGSVLEMDWFIS